MLIAHFREVVGMCKDPDCEHSREERLIEGYESQTVVDSFNAIIAHPCVEELNKTVTRASPLIKAWGECAGDGLEDARYVFLENLSTIILLKMTEGKESDDKIIQILQGGIRSYQEGAGYCQEEEKEWYIKGLNMISERIPSFIKNLKI